LKNQSVQNDEEEKEFIPATYLVKEIKMLKLYFWTTDILKTLTLMYRSSVKSSGSGLKKK
jgi:hypothetical protein